MRRINKVWWLVIMAIAILTTSTIGCTRYYRIAVIGSVRDAVSGDPLKGVTVTVDPPDYRITGTLTTDADGKFAIYIKLLESEFAGTTPKWRLTLSREGFAPSTCDVDLSLASPDPKAVDCVIVVAHLRRDAS